MAILNLTTLSLVLFLFAVLVYLVEGGYRLEKVKLPGDLSSVRVFSDSDIAQYDGQNPNLPIYMAVKGVVFDVTSGKGFYGPGMSYNALAGRDCTQAVAKMSLDPKDLNNNVKELNDRQLKSLDEIFNETYMAKYPIVGYMDYLINAENHGNEL